MDFFDVLGKLQNANTVGMEDFADKLNFFYSVIIFLLCATIVTAKQYMWSPIACYMPTVPGGKDFDDYVENYCWVHGTIPIRDNDPIVSTKEDWKKLDENRIYYYQWIPFVLALQCILFYIPHIFWQIVCYNQSGTDLEHVVAMASKAVSSDPESREKIIAHVTSTLEDMLVQHRDYRTGRVAKFRRRTFKLCSFFVISKKLGTWLVATYILTKFLYIFNAVGQLFLMTQFLGFNSSMVHFGPTIVNYILNGTSWENTLIFPRVSYCYIDNVRHLGTKSNVFIAQCSLPVNMLSEKIYIFLWFWTVFVALATILSLPIWIGRISVQNSKIKFVKKYLRNADALLNEEIPMIRNFSREFLRHDGVFLLRMIVLNAGDLVTSRIVTQLWETYKQKYKHRDLRNDTALDDEFNKALHLDPDNEGTALRKRSSAPEEKNPKEEFV